ncbi:MAG TPA: creatininase family protein [candidate division Zixibacteria bacterium]|nr:creatininase family protein [candidate division Zixibacteria bacterium]
MDEAKSKRVSSKKERLWFDELSTREAETRAKAGSVVIFPVGSVEEHGDHLPLCTDSLQPEYVALEVAKKTGCLVAPPLRYGVCNSARGFPGTVSISFNTLHKMVRDILEEFIRNRFTRILVLSGHAGQAHMAALRLAAQEVVWQHEKENPEKRPRIMVCSDYDFAYELKGKYFSEKDGHAGTIETSRVMAIRPELIKARGVKSFPEFPRFEIVADPERYFPTGVDGDPTAASPEKGRMINKYVVREVAKLVEELKR